MTREEFIAKRPLVLEFESRGVKIIGGGNHRKAKCPFHEDKNPSLSIDAERGLWKCHAGCGGGSVIDAIAMFENTTAVEVLKRECSPANGNGAPRHFPMKTQPKPAPVKETPPESESAPRPTIETVYSYQNEIGDEVYQALRLKPKSFRQRHGKVGDWTWNMDGVERVLYRLPEVLKASEVWIVEGEKDVETLRSLGFTATTNVGGAGKWMEGYTESLAGKSIVICGDNDDPGREHVQMVFSSVSGKVKEVRIVTIPKPHKDVSDYFQAMGDAAKAGLSSMREDSVSFVRGVKIPVKAIIEIQESYSQRCKSLSQSGLDLSHWLPSLRSLRTVIPGEMVTILGATGIGKTALLSNIAMAALPMPTLFFQLELPQELVFERLMALRTKMSCSFIERAYATGEKHGPDFFAKAFPGLFICSEPRFNVEQIEATVINAELKMGEKPRLILVDYIGLIKGSGQSRYDRFSQIAEDLRLMAKATQTIVICASQVGRRGSDDDCEVTLYDAKESGSIENSSSIVMGAWREPDNDSVMQVKVLKATKGGAGVKVTCNYNPDTLAITEQARYADQDKDQWHNK
jgi:5S rRNA maturation endonuclease (ribonuclease M5)/KaiC/GvpD/RAD55 family RecA-like ATPase